MKNLRTDRILDFQLGDRLVRRDETGYLVDPFDWDEELCRAIAAEEGIELTDDHWSTIHFIRSYQAEHGVSPDARFVFAHLAKEKGLNKKEGRLKFFELFPYGYVKQACKIAGMMQPRAWSTG